MNCPTCGSKCDHLIAVEVDMTDLPDYIFRRLNEKGYVVTVDDINTFLDIADEYLYLKGAIIDVDDEEGSSK